MKRTPKVGDHVAFKADVEQTGKILEIRTRDFNITEYRIKVQQGAYKGMQWVRADETW